MNLPWGATNIHNTPITCNIYDCQIVLFNNQCVAKIYNKIKYCVGMDLQTQYLIFFVDPEIWAVCDFGGK